MKILTMRHRRPVLFGFILTGLLQLAAGPLAAAESHAVVFMYHRFGETKYPSTNVTLAQFEAQLDYLAENGYRVWPLERIVRQLQAGAPIPERTVAISVDDAYLSVYTQAYPRLKARGWPFTVFVSTGPVDQGLPDFMSWAQMREMQAHGVRFANHSASHPHLGERLPGEDGAAWAARIGKDIRTAQQRLQQELGAKTNEQPRLFAYPYGEFDRATAEMLAELGFVAFGQQSGAIGVHADRRALPRYPIAEAFAELDEFALKAASLALPVIEAEPWDPAVEENPPRLRLRLAPSGARLGQFACYASGQGRIEVKRMDELSFEVVAGAPLAPGRSRYNCTAPSAEAGRWYWYSHPWLLSPPAPADRAH